jgi:hypothetical protein
MARAKSTGPIINAVQSNIEQAIAKLALRQYKQIKLPFTFEDLKRLFILPEWRDKLTEVFAYAAPGGTSYDLHAGVLDQRVGTGDRLRPVTIEFSWRSGNNGGFLPPRGIGTSLHPLLDVIADCPSELQEKFEHMMHELCGTARDFGEVKHVLSKLNVKEVCPSAGAIRYYWPCIVPLLELANNQALADELREANHRASWYAKIPAGISELLQSTNEFVARALLIEDPGKVDDLPVSYRMDEVRFGTFEGVTDR